MIVSFASKETEKIWKGNKSLKLTLEIQSIARSKLRMLNNARNLKDQRIPPNNRLESLRGEKQGFYSIRVNRQRRICFRWGDGNVSEVEIIDYH